ncbi:putative acetyltransferase EpsM [compost metagenome]
MNREVLLLGAGGHARVIIDTLQCLGVSILGVLDAAVEMHGQSILGVPVLGGDDLLADFSPSSVELVNGLGSIANTTARRGLFHRQKSQGFRFSTVVHPSAVVSPQAQLLEGAQVMAGAVIQTGCRIGVNVLVNTGALVDHDCTIGDHVHLAPGVTLSGGVEIGDGVHVGTGATIIQGRHIGNESLVAAGAVVVDHVAMKTLVMGVPAREVMR